MKQATFLWKRFAAGMAASAILTPLPYSRSPFTSGERALSEDWKQVGADLRAVLAAHKAPADISNIINTRDEA